MKVAVATFDGQVSEHFGKCQGFTFATVEANEIKDVENMRIIREGIVPFFRSLLGSRGH